ncbi:MAG: valine--tRNA ligase [Flavobacteriales bacterium]|nr:MAG: valine--tRNA ligase [Flavobacteriales bacterium]
MQVYQPQELEAKWYAYWMKNHCFRSVPDQREPYTIVIPPPNVTGVLHMGHMLNNTIQDVLIRRARLLGKNACWVPGTDHASIATEAKVVARLAEQGISKNDLGREKFLEEAWKWTEEYGGIILDQLKRLGASCDWDRTAFTLDETRYSSVIKTFRDLYEQGLIYRGFRMVNWDPQAKTTISDEEVIHKDVQAKLYHVRYQIENSEESLVIATTRPETILGDTAICIHPEDERYTHLHGKRAIVPIANRSIPIILDEYVDREFGTGCLKVTPAHDVNDYALGERHDLEIVDVLNEDGTLNQHGLHYQGQDRFRVRKAIAKELAELGALVKEEEYATSVGTSERTGAVIEPRLSRQWFLRMEELCKPALEAVDNAEVKLVPEKFGATYRHWMENIRDWCISRQLWWGHQIPAFYYGTDEDFVVAESAEEALKLIHTKHGNTDIKLEDLRQDADVLDTWFSSWLWPLSVFDGINNPENEEITYYYPTNDLVSGPDILFFWIARMIMAGYHMRAEKPFSNVYLTGIVRDEKGRKMSKQLGNSPDALKLIEKYGADGVRVGILLSAPAGNDLLFNEDLCTQGRNFGNKIWNAYNLIQQWTPDANQTPAEGDHLAIEWFENRLAEVLTEVNHALDRYRLSDALMMIYKLVWDDFCSWYLEMIKPRNSKVINAEVYERSLELFEKLLVILHPYMPFISEELWQSMRQRAEGETIMYAAWPQAKEYDSKVLKSFEEARSIITQVRQVRMDKQIGFKEDFPLLVNAAMTNQFTSIICKMARLSSIDQVTETPENSVSFLAAGHTFYFPLGDSIDVEAEKAKIVEELNYLKGFLGSVEKKLSNERFVANAPAAVIDNERKKQSDAQDKIAQLEERLASF